MSPYRWTLEQLLDEERRLRGLAEEQVRAYRKLLVTLAMQLVPQEVDARRRQDPGFANGLTPDGWQALFAAHPPAPVPRQNGWIRETPQERLQARIAQLEEENGELRREIVGLREKRSAISDQASAGESTSPGASSQPRSDTRRLTPETCPSQPPIANRQFPIAITQHPPPRYASLFQNWQREGLALALLATTGWNLRYAIDEALSAQIGIGVGSGSSKRLFRRLEKQGLVQQQVYDLGKVRAAILVLTERGRTVARSAGFSVTPCEWDTLMEQHGGQRQAGHAALCCTFAYQARRRGWQVTLCPDVDGPAQPDVAIHNGAETIYVEVEAGSGEPERRMKKWRNQDDLQGFVALCANTANVRQRLVTEATAACKHGLATDVPALIQDSELWVEGWGRRAIGG